MDALLRRRSMIAAGGGEPPTPPQPQPILPAGFTELAYVSTNSSAYIDTGIAGATDLEITTKFYVGTYIMYGFVYGNHIDDSYHANRALLTGQTQLTVGGGLNTSQAVNGFSLSAVHTLVVNSTTAILDGVSTSIASESGSSNSNNICLGNRSLDNPVDRNIGLRIYSFEIKKNGTTVLNLVPAMRDSDDAVGFYDLVSESFVKSLTGTEFVAGPANNYAPVNYIATDGTAYINTGIIGADPRSMEIRCVVKRRGDYILATSEGAENAKNYTMLYISNNADVVGLGHYYFFSGGFPSVQDSIENGTPFIARCAMKKGAQSMSVKMDGASDYTTVTKTQNTAVNTGRTMYLFGTNTGGNPAVSVSGTRVYYCKIYSDNTYGGLVFDGVPCYYNGEYGLWDKVSGVFFGNAAASGAFTGSNS